MKHTFILNTILMVVFAFLAGCGMQTTVTEQPVTSPVASNIPTLISTTVLPTMSPTRTPTITPVPTLSQQIAIETFVNLIEKDTECTLPCWLGVIPGQTKFDEVNTLLSRFGAIAYSDFSSQWITFRVFFPDFETAIHDVDTSIASGGDGMVSRILIHAVAYQDKNGPRDYNNPEFQRMWQRFFVSEIFRRYGMPEEIFLDTTRITADPAGSYPFVLWIIYPQQGFLMRYQGSNIKIRDDIQICPMQSKIEIKIWNRENSNYEEFMQDDRALGVSTSLGPQPIESVTDFTVESFYETFRSSQLNTCFETPASIWPH